MHLLYRVLLIILTTAVAVTPTPLANPGLPRSLDVTDASSGDQGVRVPSLPDDPNFLTIKVNNGEQAVGQGVSRPPIAIGPYGDYLTNKDLNAQTLDKGKKDDYAKENNEMDQAKLQMNKMCALATEDSNVGLLSTINRVPMIDRFKAGVRQLTGEWTAYDTCRCEKEIVSLSLLDEKSYLLD